MAKAKKTKKTRSDKYDPKLAIKGSFEDVIKVSVGKPPATPPAEKKEEKSKDKKK